MVAEIVVEDNNLGGTSIFSQYVSCMILKKYSYLGLLGCGVEEFLAVIPEVLRD